MQGPPKSSRLSDAQARFAANHGAHLGIGTASPDGMVYLYREEPWATYRWLVDRLGRAFDFDRFFKEQPDY